MLLTAPPLRILLTGAAGLLGGEIAGRLLARGHGVTAMVHRAHEIRRNDGARLPAADWNGAPPKPGELLTLTADLRREAFGWDRGDAAGAGCVQARVGATHELIIHCAAVTRFDAEPAVYHAVNIEGTARVLALAEAAGLGVLHVSTAYVCGTSEGVILEREAAGQAFANGYEASKAAAERLVRAARVPSVIARPSIVVGEHATGVIRCFDTIYTVLKLLGEGYLHTLLANPDATLDLVPIDHVAAGIVALTERFSSAAGGIFHLVSGMPTPVGAFRTTLAAIPGLAVPTLVAPKDFEPDALPPGQRRLHQCVQPYAGYFRRNPRFDDTAFRAFTGLACPPIDDAYLQRLVEHCLDAGFLRAGVGAAAQASRSAVNGMASEAPIPVSEASR